MQRFLRKIALFLVPFLLFWLAGYIILILSGEFIFDYRNFTQSLITGKKHRTVAYLFRDHRSYHYLKLNAALAKKPEVLALGSSRVLQFRAQMFSSSFYNAGFTVSGIQDFRVFLEKLQDSGYSPRILLINLDHWMFNHNWDSLARNLPITFTGERPPNPLLNFRECLTAWNLTLSNQVPLSQLFHSHQFVGLDAHHHHHGIRYDGSWHDGKQLPYLRENNPRARDFNFSNTFGRIEKGTNFFEYGHEINLHALKELEFLLAYCRNKNIYVVAFLPPFASEVWHKMQLTGNYGYLEQVQAQIPQLFGSYNFPVFNFSVATSSGSSDAEMVDGFHGSEKANARMLVKMARADSILGTVVQTEQLQQLIDKSKDRFTIYSD